MERELGTPRLRWLAVLASIVASPVCCAADERAVAADEVQMLSTPDGVGFAVLGPKPPTPAPTLFNFASDAVTPLKEPVYQRAGALLSKQGYLCVSVDLPCHGQQKRADEPEGLTGWRHRVDRGEDPMAELTTRLKSVLDYLIEQGYTDPNCIAACGTSRGGFSALHFAAADPRVKCVAAYAPVTDLKALREFSGAEDAPLVRQLALAHHADKLAGRPVWIIIGDRDERVDTDLAIQFARAISAASAKQGLPSQVELHVCPSQGHATPAGGAEQSADWIARCLAATH